MGLSLDGKAIETAAPNEVQQARELNRLMTVGRESEVEAPATGQSRPRKSDRFSKRHPKPTVETGELKPTLGDSRSVVQRAAARGLGWAEDTTK